jgi:hypothetical protein
VLADRVVSKLRFVHRVIERAASRMEPTAPPAPLRAAS